MKIEDIKNGIIREIKPLSDYKENEHQYYTARGNIYYSAGSGGYRTIDNYKKEYEKAIEELIAEGKIKEITSKYEKTRMFIVGDKF